MEKTRSLRFPLKDQNRRLHSPAARSAAAVVLLRAPSVKCTTGLVFQLFFNAEAYVRG